MDNQRRLFVGNQPTPPEGILQGNAIGRRESDSLDTVITSRLGEIRSSLHMLDIAAQRVAERTSPIRFPTSSDEADKVAQPVPPQCDLAHELSRIEEHIRTITSGLDFVLDTLQL